MQIKKQKKTVSPKDLTFEIIKALLSSGICNPKKILIRNVGT
jgi:hypothetical protein